MILRTIFTWLVCLVAWHNAAQAQSTPHRVFIAGDSTASAYEADRAPRQGWGMALQSFLEPSVWEVRNHAQSGRSARSFIDQGWLDGIEKELRKGDVLLIQFGHNDQKLEDPTRYNEPQQAYPSWLKRYLELARTRGATPILITPLARRKFDGGQLLDTHGLYAQAVRRLAEDEKVALIDLTTISMDWLRALGPEASKLFYMHVPEARTPTLEQADDTHLHARGAVQVACLVLARWRVINPEINPHIMRDTDCGAQAVSAEQSHKASSAVLRAEQVDALAREQPGPHAGPGLTTGHSMFADVEGVALHFRKRVLPAGSGIGLHTHRHDEVYYVLEGQARYILDGTEHELSAGAAMLTRAGSTHAIYQDGADALVLLISYPRAEH